MTATPSDASSLLVPIHLDAWVTDKQSQALTAVYTADYTRLPQFKGLLDAPFQPSTAPSLAPGVRLHWALPDALTHGHTPPDGGETIFPLVPNRWLVARFNAPAAGGWQCQLWVVESDHVGGAVGVTPAALTAANVTSVPLAAASKLAVSNGDQLQIVSPDGLYAATVTASADAPQGSTSVTIQPFTFTNDSTLPNGLPSGSGVTLLAGSNFLDPSQPSTMRVANDGSTTFKVNLQSIGKTHDIKSWQASSGAAGQLFLQAVGPGNVSFAAYMPTVSDVFSFTDSELPPGDAGVVYDFTYMVVGWYSDPAQGDPLRGVNAYDPAVWATQEEWQKDPDRMKTLLAYLKWSVDAGGSAAPPPLATSLYHGLVADVQWPPPPPNPDSPYPGKIDRDKVHVAVGNTSTDALTALVKSEAQAQAAADPTHQSAWLTAGDTLAQLMQAAMYDLLDQYGKPGGAVLIRQQIEQAWFGSAPGGTLWEVVRDSPQTSAQTAEALPPLTPRQAAAVNAALAALNASQVALDESERRLWSLQAQLYQMWWKVGRAQSYSLYGSWDSEPTTYPDWSNLMPFVLSLYQPLFNATWQQFCAYTQAGGALPDPTPAKPDDPRAPDVWANANTRWLFPDAAGNPQRLKLVDLGLHLKGSARPNFWHPNDPVLMISGIDRSQRHGEDGRHNGDGTLTCRLPGQTITGVQIPGQPAINTQTVTRGGVNLNPCGTYSSLPSIPALVAEAFFVDPSNAPVIARAVAGSDAQAVKAAVTLLLGGGATGGAWAGKPPAPFSIAPWEQGWAPLFLEWSVNYYPTGNDYQFSPSDWQFDGEEYAWLGTGYDQDTQVGYVGRTLLTPQAPLTFKSKIQAYLKNNPGIDSSQLDSLIQTVAGWDVLSQTLSGLTDQLITLVSQETFAPPPPAGVESAVACPPLGAQPPALALLVGDQYHSVPVVETSKDDAFFPVRAGFVEFQSLQIVDAFGQVYGGSTHSQGGQHSVWVNTTNGFQPTLGQGLGLSCAPTVPPAAARAALAQLPVGSFQLPPRVVQATRLNLNFLANDGSGKDVSVSANPNPVCGWLLPNHLDGGISVYDADGLLLGELLALPPGQRCDNWRPRPGDPGTKPPPACPPDIPNAALRAVVQSIAAQTPDVFGDLLKTIDETLWMVDPLGGRKDQFLSVLIGRPLAVVQAEVSLTLQGEPVFSQFWDKMVTPPEGQSRPPSDQQPPYTWLKDTGGVLDVSLPVRLGSLELRDDGLIGYFLPSADDYATFYAVHYPDKVTGGDKYLQPIVDASPRAGSQPYQGNVFLKPNGAPVLVTMLVDPRGSVHAYTGVLPVVSASLPGPLVEEFIRNLLVTFRTGPVMADPGTLRIPQPAEQHGVWTWVQAVAPPAAGKGTVWEEDTIVDADDRARMPDRQLQLREGWLKLTGLDEPAG